MKFTTAELKVLSNLVDINLTGIGDEALAEEIKSDFGYFKLKSVKQAWSISDKINDQLSKQLRRKLWLK